MHLPRQLLRKILFDKLQRLDPSGQSVIWDCKLEKIMCEEDGILLKMSKREEKVDLVIGCDGIFSSVRQLGTV